ncbi:MAG: extradiol dioxygenase family protein [Saprospiraceae bacterium]|jgi:extradiol dioxygenase family protein
MLKPFHLAIQVRDLEEARHFYGQTMGFEEGRSSKQWIDYNFYGHQFVVHHNTQLGKDGTVANNKNPVDGQGVPVPHFGVVLDQEDWQQLANKLTRAGTQFIIEPYIRFKGETGEQGTFFFSDPSGNMLEFKTFADPTQLFAK